MTRQSTTGEKGLHAASRRTGAKGPVVAVPSVASRQCTPVPISPAAEALHGVATHNTTTALDGAGVSGATFPKNEAHPAETPTAGESTERDEEIEEIEELEKRVENMERQLEREEAEPETAVISRPLMPTKEQVERHNASGHAQFRNWCKHCVRGLATRDRHISKRNKKGKVKTSRSGEADVPDVECKSDGLSKFSIDYMRMDSKDEDKSRATMVMVNHEDGGVFAYATPGKGIAGDKYWLPKRMAKDIDNCGSQEVQVQIKSDQEPAIVTVQEEIRAIRRGKTICVNSPVGESECNGRAENAIRRVEVKVRTLRSFIEENTKRKMDMNKPFGTWLIRWAGEILTKYTHGKDGKTPWERRRREACKKAVIPIGEKVLYLPLKTASIHHKKGEPKMEEGIWLGVNGRTEETLIGTTKGVVKCRTVRRLPEDKCWDGELIDKMQGTTWQPVPGYRSDHIPVEIDEHGKKSEREEEDKEIVDYEAIPMEEGEPQAVRVRSSPVTDIRVTHKDLEKHGCTPGCPACEYVLSNQKIARGVAHSRECRQRIRDSIEVDDNTKERIERAEERKKKHEGPISLVDRSLPRHLSKLSQEMHTQMMKLVAEDIDVAEIYSPPRVAARAKLWGLKGGWSLDLTTKDRDGKRWDFSKREMRRRAIEKIKADKPLLIIGSPMCTDWSTMMFMNWPRMTQEEKDRRMREARSHLRFCVKIYRHQADQNRYYVHEHPMNAASWKEPEMKRLMKKEKSILAKIDQCQYGLWVKDKEGWAASKKPTKILTNSVCIANQMKRRCPGKHAHANERHAALFSGVSKQAQVYPPGLCDAICQGLKDQIEMDRTGRFLLATVSLNDDDGDHQSVIANMMQASDAKIGSTVEESQEEALMEAWDDVSGKELDPNKVVKARREEVEYIHKTRLYTKVPRQKAKDANAKVITVRWIDINKGDQQNENYRSRLVAREIKKDGRPDLFAATPPLEALKIILSMLANSNKGEKLMVNDVSRAYFCAPARRQVFVELPEEDKDSGDMVGELNFSMYGTRDAAQNWGEECAKTMTDMGFERGTASPCTFFHRDRQIRTYIHGDDYVSVGQEEDLQWMKRQIEKKYELKTQVLGPSKTDKQEVRVLNRIISWKDNGIQYEADPRHVEIVLKELNLENSKEVCSPGTKEEGKTKEEHKEALDATRASAYRGIVARLNYLSADRADISFAVKEVARSMSAPTKGSWEQLKRLGRYLVGRPRAVMHYKWQDTPYTMRTYTDADWAGCKESRKSTTGGAIMLGGHTLKTWSKTQSLIALSSGESEFYAALKASAETLGMLAMLRDFGIKMTGEVHGDASAALGIINRKGLGRTRHIDTGLLWIQQTAAEKRLSYLKVLGTDNPADLMTKHLGQEVLTKHSWKLGVTFPGGRAETAPNLHHISVTRALWEEEEGTEEHEDHDEELLSRLQSMVNEVWRTKWKKVVLKNCQRRKGVVSSTQRGLGKDVADKHEPRKEVSDTPQNLLGSINNVNYTTAHRPTTNHDKELKTEGRKKELTTTKLTTTKSKRRKEGKKDDTKGRVASGEDESVGRAGARRQAGEAACGGELPQVDARKTARPSRAADSAAAPAEPRTTRRQLQTSCGRHSGSSSRAADEPTAAPAEPRTRRRDRHAGERREPNLRRSRDRGASDTRVGHRPLQFCLVR